MSYPPPAPGPLEYGGYGEPQRTSGAAVTALVLGILAILSACIVPVVLAIPAIIFGAIGIAKTGRPQVKGRGMAIAGLVMGLVSVVLGLTLGVAILLPSLNRAREAANRIKCGSNLRQIGQAMRQYAIDDVRSGYYPPDLETLYAAAQPGLGLDAFICPTSAAAAAPPPFVVGQNNSYVYLAAGLTDAAPATTPVAHCETHIHGDGTNILYSDGSVRFVLAAQYPPEVQPTAGP
jgi:prepilin-type processing-associated H-X9-DG protein